MEPLTQFSNQRECLAQPTGQLPYGHLPSQTADRKELISQVTVRQLLMQSISLRIYHSDCCLRNKFRCFSFPRSAKQHRSVCVVRRDPWIPACAGMTRYSRFALMQVWQE